MTRTAIFATVAVLIVVLAAAPAAAQQAPAASTPVARSFDQNKMRRHIYTMEGALARAVEFGAKRLNRELRSVIPELMVLSGQPQARGVYLEGYGVYFDVAVPVLNQMMVLTLQSMVGSDQNIVAALQQLKTYIRNEVKNPTTQAALENQLERLELQLGPLAAANDALPVGAPSPNAVGAAVLTPEPAAVADPAPRIDRKYLQDPNAINREYTESVQEALIDTMIDYAAPLTIRPDEYLTVGARDNMHRDTLAPPDPYEEVVTILLRIKGSDLEAYRRGEIDAGEVRRRVQVREQ